MEPSGSGGPGAAARHVVLDTRAAPERRGPQPALNCGCGPCTTTALNTAGTVGPTLRVRERRDRDLPLPVDRHIRCELLVGGVRHGHSRPRRGGTYCTASRRRARLTSSCCGPERRATRRGGGDVCRAHPGVRPVKLPPHIEQGVDAAGVAYPPTSTSGKPSSGSAPRWAAKTKSRHAKTGSAAPCTPPAWHTTAAWPTGPSPTRWR
jgi:hypothetical protein